jgi:hypothetical protein
MTNLLTRDQIRRMEGGWSRGDLLPEENQISLEGKFKTDSSPVRCVRTIVAETLAARVFRHTLNTLNTRFALFDELLRAIARGR